MENTSMIRKISLGLVLVVALMVAYQVDCRDHRFSGFIERMKDSVHRKHNHGAHLLDKLLLDTLPKLLGYPPANINGTAEENKYLALHDSSNDEIATSTVQEILSRSGYRYTDHYSVADDGYVTQITRIINPRADPTKLKQPPVIIFHGGLIDPTAYIYSSAIQHHPEPWPRTPEDGPMTSSNRSLGLMLSNNGFDVFLVSTRGSNALNKARSNPSILLEAVRTDNPGKDLTKAEFLLNTLPPSEYFNYNMDRITNFEVENQINKVLEVTGAKKASVFSYSLSTVTTLSLFSQRPDIVAEKLHNYILMGPVINNKDGQSKFFQSFVKNICVPLPPEVGTFILSHVLTTQPTRNAIVSVGTSRHARYLLNKLVVNLLTGSSAKYRTFLEPAVLGHILQGTSWLEFQQYCQQAVASRMQRYDYGAKKNLELYGQETPPIYDISTIKLPEYMVISAANDNLAPQGSVKQIIEELSTNAKPYKHIFIEEYNHQDMLAAFDNDIRVNLPVLEFLNKFRYETSDDS